MPVTALRCQIVSLRDTPFEQAPAACLDGQRGRARDHGEGADPALRVVMKEGPVFVAGVQVFPGAMDKATLARAIADARRL